MVILFFPLHNAISSKKIVQDQSMSVGRLASELSVRRVFWNVEEKTECSFRGTQVYARTSVGRLEHLHSFTDHC